MIAAADGEGFGLLIAAHGEANEDAGNRNVARLAAALARREIAAEVRAGFLKGQPAIGEAVGAFAARQIVVFPLFLSDGYFNRVRLPQALDAGRRKEQTIRLLPPLGLEPALADLVGRKAAAAAASRGFDLDRTTLVLLGHGAQNDCASRSAAEWLAGAVGRQGRFPAVRTAFLEEPPALEESVSGVAGPIVVVGLFLGDGLHGAGDAPRLVAALGRDDAILAGNVGGYPEIADIVAAAVAA